MTEIKSYYGARATERRRQFNKIIDGIDAVLMNKIEEVDDSVRDNFEGKNPFYEAECDIHANEDKEVPEAYYCETHNRATDEEYECEDYEGTTEVYQWFAINDGDAEFLKRHNQYIAYSEVLDTYFWAITHFGTSWDYVDSMVSAFDDCYHGLEDFKDGED